MQKMSPVASKLIELCQFFVQQGDMKYQFHKILKSHNNSNNNYLLLYNFSIVRPFHYFPVFFGFLAITVFPGSP